MDEVLEPILLSSRPYLAVLGPKEIEIVDDAENFIGRPLPSNNNDRNVYAYHNLRLQNLVNQLKSNVLWARAGRINLMKTKENSLRTDAREDGVRDKEERSSYCYNNAKWRDLHDTVTKLDILQDRLNSLEWMLKSGLQYIGKLQQV
jgi:hypothetical protein